MKKKTKDTEKRCTTCGRIIVDKKNKTSICPKCTKKGLEAGAAVAVAAPVVAVGIKKYGEQIVKGIATVARIVLKK